MSSLGTVMGLRRRLENYKANRAAGSYKGTEGYFNIDEVAELEARLAAAEKVVEAARDDGHTHAIEECPVCAAIRAYEKAYFQKQGRCSECDGWIIDGPEPREMTESPCTCNARSVASEDADASR